MWFLFDAGGGVGPLQRITSLNWSPSASMKARGIRRYGVDPAKAFVIPPGVDLEVLVVARAKSPDRRVYAAILRNLTAGRDKLRSSLCSWLD
jgi:glycosyltransferase involved in cell wall biosynthesis